MEGRLTQHEIEAAQSQRTVNRVTPGKMFMINFIAGEQSVASIANRVNSVAVVAVGGLLLALLWGNPIEASWILPALGVYAPIFMHYHIGTKGSVYAFFFNRTAIVQWRGGGLVMTKRG